MPDIPTSGVARQRAESIRFDIARANDGAINGRQLLVFVDGVELTSAGAGMGTDPRELLVRGNRLIATEVPHRFPIARCSCGEYGCGSTDVTIVREGSVVHWDWHLEVPLPHGVSFDARQYDEEVARIGSDFSWEAPWDTSARLILTGVDRQALAASGLRISGVTPAYDDTSALIVLLTTTDHRFHVLLREEGAGKSPESVADDVLAQLATDPSTWEVRYSSIRTGRASRPPMAGPRWTPKSSEAS